MDFQKLEKERRDIGSLSAKDHGANVMIAGWVYDVRDLGKVRFVVVRDQTGEVQLIAHKDKAASEVYAAMGSVSRESAVVVTGPVQKSDKASGGREVVPSVFEVVGPAEATLPIDTSDFSKTELPKRLDYRFLDLHRRRTQAIFAIQSTLAHAFRSFFVSKGFMEMQPPCVIGGSSEGGADYFEVKYFEKKAALAQSPQLYKQMLACSVGKTFMVTPVWRAEKHNTVRHINEIRQMDIEVGFANTMAVMHYQEAVVKHMIAEVLEHNKKELELLGVSLKVPKAKYMSYDEAIDLISENGVELSKGDDFTPDAEKKLGELFPDTIVFVHTWPTACRPFYVMPSDGTVNCEYTEGFDAIYKGLEISSGGQRIHLPELLIGRIKKKGLKPEHFKDYIDSFRYGAPPHAGWSIGLERMTLLLCGLDNIREATLFPRDRDRLTP